MKPPIVILSDFHCPFQDKEAVAVVLRFLRKYQPRSIILDGDVADFYAMSKFNKSPARAGEQAIKVEVDEVHSLLRSIRQACPDAEIAFVVGNHEFRLRRFIYAQSLDERVDFTILNMVYGIKHEELLIRLLGLDELDILLHDLDPEIAKFTDNFIKVGRLFVGH